jgi:hypothetical protein
MNKIRRAITIFEEDSALTVLKPYFNEHHNMLFVIQEDAYGDAIGILMTIDDLKLRLNVNELDFNEMLINIQNENT